MFMYILKACIVFLYEFYIYIWEERKNLVTKFFFWTWNLKKILLFSRNLYEIKWFFENILRVKRGNKYVKNNRPRGLSQYIKLEVNTLPWTNTPTMNKFLNFLTRKSEKKRQQFYWNHRANFKKWTYCMQMAILPTQYEKNYRNHQI